MIDDFEFKSRYDLDDLLHIMQCLRAPGGCPWDAEQTHESIKKNLIEETYEVIEAINKRDKQLLLEELGDLLLHFSGPDENAAGDYVRELNLTEGVCRTAFASIDNQAHECRRHTNENGDRHQQIDCMFHVFCVFIYGTQEQPCYCLESVKWPEQTKVPRPFPISNL